MELNIRLPESVRAKVKLRENEDMHYCSPYDISTSGCKQELCYLAVTNLRLLRIDCGGIADEIEIKDIETVKCEPCEIYNEACYQNSLHGERPY